MSSFDQDTGRVRFTSITGPQEIHVFAEGERTGDVVGDAALEAMTQFPMLPPNATQYSAGYRLKDPLIEAAMPIVNTPLVAHEPVPAESSAIFDIALKGDTVAKSASDIPLGLARESSIDVALKALVNRRRPGGVADVASEIPRDAEYDAAIATIKKEDGLLKAQTTPHVRVSGAMPLIGENTATMTEDHKTLETMIDKYGCIPENANIIDDVDTYQSNASPSLVVRRPVVWQTRLAKAIIYRVLSSLVTFTVAFVVTQNVSVAGLLGAADVLKVALYWAFDTQWEKATTIPTPFDYLNN